jgi:serine/threonine protein kinase
MIRIKTKNKNEENSFGFEYYYNKEIIDFYYKKYSDENSNNNENNNNDNDLKPYEYCFCEYENDYQKYDKEVVKSIKEEFKIYIMKIIFRQVCDAINHLHKLKIAHRDIKVENVLFTSEDGGLIKLIDFSISTIIINRTKIGEPSGGSLYSSPDCIDSGSNYNPFKLDVWSFGVLMYLFYTRLFPFDGESDLDREIKITQGEPIFSETFNPELKDLLCKIFEKKDENRSNILNVRSHKFFSI